MAKRNPIGGVCVGNKVRSFDFADGKFGRDLEGERAAYVEGFVTGIVKYIPDEDGFLRETDCPRYEIKCTKRVFGGKEVKPEGDIFYPLINGTPTLGGRVTDIVEVIR